MWLSVLCLTFGQIVTLCGLALPLLTKLIFDFVLTDAHSSAAGNPFAFLLNGNFGDIQSWRLFWSICITFVLVLLVRHILHFLRFNLSHWYGVNYEAKLRMMTFRKMLTQNNIVLSRYSSGDILTILNGDTIQFKELFTFTIPFIIDKVILVVFSAILLFGINPYLAIAPFAISPLLILTSVLYMKRARTVSDDIRNKTAELSQTVQENINGVRIVRSLASEEFELKKFDKVNANFRQSYFDHTSMWTKYGFLFNLIRIAIYLVSIGVGTYLAIVGTITIGDFVAFTTYVALITDAITQLVNLLFQVQQFMVAGKRIYTFTETGDIIKNPDEPEFIHSKPNISIRNMTIMMDDQIVLDDINIEIPYGKKLGIMGSTGSGKSVLLKALTRTYDPYKGTILINGNNIRKIDLESLRGQYALVFQDVFLFSNTIDANIAYYDDSISHEDVVEVAKIAQAHDFILQTEDGYDTVVGENGIGLSGGQKQRISIARALLKHAPVLVLDSATSALDHETEVALMNGIMQYDKNATLIISSHRASSLKNCDEIIYLDAGKIIERGTHEQLMKLGGKYASIYNLQAALSAEGTI